VVCVVGIPVDKMLINITLLPSFSRHTAPSPVSLLPSPRLLLLPVFFFSPHAGIT
jgi:hypothetical protein